jgi:hypothetical protein
MAAAAKVTETEAAFKAGAESAKTEGRVVEVAGIPLLVASEGQSLHFLQQVLKLAEERGAAPPRRKGTACHHELVSFTAHVNRQKSEDSVIWADADQVRLTAVLNYNPAGPAAESAAWGDHRAI